MPHVLCTLNALAEVSKDCCRALKLPRRPKASSSFMLDTVALIRPMYIPYRYTEPLGMLQSFLGPCTGSICGPRLCVPVPEPVAVQSLSAREWTR